MKVSLNLLWKYSLAIFLIMSIGFGTGDLSFLSSIALYMFLGISIICVVRRKKIGYNLYLISLVLFFVVLIVGSLFSPTPDEQIFEVIYDYFTMMIICFCIFQYIRCEDDFMFTVNMILIGTIVMSFYTYSLYGTAFWTILKNNSFAAENNIMRISLGRMGSGNANVLGTRCSLGFIICIFFLFFDKTVKTPLKKIFYSLSSVICVIMAFASGSKKTMFIIVLGFLTLVLVAIENTKNGYKKIKYILGSGIALIIMGYLIATLPIFSGFATRIRTFASFIRGKGNGGISETARSSLISVGFRVWLDNFFFGKGTYASYSYFGVYCHNNFIEILMNNGLLGFIIFYSSFVYYIKEFFMYRKIWWKKNRLSGLLGALFFSVFICGYFFVYYYDRFMMIIIMLAYSMMKYCQIERE